MNLMKKRMKKRIISGLLVVTMLAKPMPGFVLAADDAGKARVGLCEHHPAHTQECGYAESAPEMPCLHEHTEECYEVIAHCTHVHGPECTPQTDAMPEEGMPTEHADPTASAADGETPANKAGDYSACTHQCSVDSGCLEKILNCGHTHDETCGYKPASEGSPCTFVCADCQAAESEGQPESESEPATESEAVVESESESESETETEVESEPVTESEIPIESETVPESETESESEAELESETESESETSADMADWPAAPQWSQQPGMLAEGEMLGDMYGRPGRGMTSDELADVQAASLALPVAEDPAKRIPEDEVSSAIFIYVNGEVYTGGDLTVLEGDNFSWKLSWSPKLKSDEMTWEDGSWFEAVIFMVPGLNLGSYNHVSLVINGIKVGEYSLNYNRQKGTMTYKAVFNRYIQLFDPVSVFAYIQGSGKFVDASADGSISVMGDNGNLTIESKPIGPEVPQIPSGTGWQPSKAPVFNDTVYGFGKGVNWDSSGNSNADPQIEWRIAFLEQLQKTQRDFLDGKALTQSKGYIIIEDTLDGNQEFVRDDAPFFLELPVIVPGTGNILNGLSGVGNANYDGPGEIYSLFTGDTFTEISGRDAHTSDEILKVQKYVKETPLTWTVTTDPNTRQQTLLINAGKLGTTDPATGVTWGKSSDRNWPVQELQKRIDECTSKIDAIKNGTDSPIALLEQRETSLLNLLNTGINLPQNQKQIDELRGKVQTWNEDFRRWRDDLQVSYLQPLERENADGSLTLLVALPQTALIGALEDCIVKSDGTALKDTQEYEDYLLSLANLLSDQRTYLENRLNYGNDWEAAREHYQNALDFYSTGAVYGFVVKVRSRSINTSTGTYSNTVNIGLDDLWWIADDTHQVRFAGDMIGNYSLGDVVLQKADAYYDTGDDVTDIQTVENDQAGLAGAQFRVYRGDANNPEAVPELLEANLAHFIDKDASVSGDTYRYTHTGAENPGGLAGDVETLTVNDDGKLMLTRMVSAYPHWLVETKAPDGYYLDPTPIRFDSDDGQVSYQMLPNVSRSVLLYKRDAYSGNPVEGAQFALYQVKEGQEVPVTGFVSKSLNGHETYVKSSGGKDLLKTNADGELCIHGLDAGKYVLKETKAAPGYIRPADTKEFSFELSESLPEKAEGSYDENYHYLLNTKEQPLKNEPGVAELTMNKVGISNTPLEGAAFALFRFKGTEAQWHENPDEETLWEAVDLEKTQKEGAYFKTQNSVEAVRIDVNGQFLNQVLKSVVTNDSGQFTITDIPLGHYAVSEVAVPEDNNYVRDYRSFYFTVDADAVDSGELQLYTEPQEKNPLKDNRLKNYQKKVQLALVKYDPEIGIPKIAGEKLKDGWQYTDSVLEPENKTPGLSGAVYKLFMRRGAGIGVINPYPKELEDSEKILGYRPGYDTCVAMGKTDESGVLQLEDMEGPNGNPIEGLNPAEYYMIEVSPPKGYLLDQEAIHFALSEDVFPDNPDMEPGLVMAAANQKADYGLKLLKTDASDGAGIWGAGFEVRKGEDLLSFTGAVGQYVLSEQPSEDAVTTVFTGDDGKMTITGLTADTDYMFTETKVPQGYRTPVPAPITVRTASGVGDGKLNGDIVFPRKDIEVINERLKGEVTLHKQAAETMEALGGAEFALYQVVVEEISPGEPGYDPTNPHATHSRDVLLDTKTTDDDGNLSFTGLEWGSYYLQEIEAPEGYVLNQSKLSFTINRNSFDADGNPITVQFPMITNRKGNLGEAVLYKSDVDDTDKRLPDAHFYLEKYVGTDASGKEIWVGYGQGMYKTDTDGKIPFLLPAGDYRLSEMKAPDGYVLEGMKEVRFTIEETFGEEKPELVVIDDGDGDGLVTNKKGDTGVYVKKTLGFSDTPVSGITFHIGWQHIDIETHEITYEPLYFVPLGDGEYEYTKDAGAPSVTTQLRTGADGQIYAMMPMLDPPESSKISGLYCQEVAAPDGLVIDPTIHPITLTEGIFSEVRVANKVKPEVEQALAITIHKTDGKSKLGLAGAEFSLYWYDGTGEGSETSHILIGTGVTDAQGNLVFDQSNVLGLFDLRAGETYHIVETKAPVGYVLDETHYEVVLDDRHFDENFNFTGAVLNITNGQMKGSVTLKKVAENDHEKGLAGAEFELLRRVADASSMDSEWAHYGELRYVTDENGSLLIENLPCGSYQLVERAAPLGYLLGDPVPSLSFQITEDGQRVDLGLVENPEDPNPVRDVFVMKVAAHDAELVLPGAEFQLYRMEDDGEYHLLQENVYVTDENGSFVIEALPVGTYALKEIKAPNGYDLPSEPMTYFSVKVEEREVALTIENKASEKPSETVDVTVRKDWKDNGQKRPTSVDVVLYRNGSVYGSPVTLNAEKNWTHTWQDLESGVAWTVDERIVPEGYEKSVTHEDNAWVITNTFTADPNIPPLPPETGESDAPEKDEPESDGSEESDMPETDETKADGTSAKTGDDSPLLLWWTILKVSGLVLIGVFTMLCVRKKCNKKS